MRNTSQTVAALCVLVLLPALVQAQAPSELPDLSLEELMGIEVERVFGASQRLQPVTEAPASVTIVTAEQIARYGYRSLADILRGARGLYVTDDRNYTYVGVRGFARSGDYNTRILLLINGHRVNDNVFDQAAIGADLGIDAAMFERVEIIRGPVSSLYGTNAFFAVVNVITRSGATLGGGSVTAGGGSLGTERVRASFGRRLSNGVDFALSTTVQRRDGQQLLYFPAFDTPETNGGFAEGLDGEQYGQVYGRVAFRGWAITGLHGARGKDVPAASYGTAFNEQHSPEHTNDQRTMIDAVFERPVGKSRMTARASFDRYAYDGVYPYSADEPGLPLLVNFDSALGTRWGLDTRVTRQARGRQTVTVGAELFDNLQQHQTNSYDQPAETGFVVEASSYQGGVYVQDEIRLHRRVLVDLGLRYDGYQGTSRVTPRAALVFTPSTNQSFKYLFGNAFRAPNVYELDYHTGGVRNTGLGPESIDTHEVVWERYAGEWLRTSASGYWYTARNLITLQPDPASFDGLGFVNGGRASAEGTELEAEVRFRSGVQGTASYAVQRATDEETGAALTNSPRHMAKIRTSVPLWSSRSFLAFELQHLSRRATLAGTLVEPATVANVTITGRLGRTLQVVGAVRNLFDRRYADPASDEHLQDSIPQDGRTVGVEARWTFLRP